MGAPRVFPHPAAATFPRKRGKGSSHKTRGF